MTSRQAEWQQRKKAAGRCVICGSAPIFKGDRCAAHYAALLEQVRARYHRRHPDARHYRPRTGALTGPPVHAAAVGLVPPGPSAAVPSANYGVPTPSDGPVPVGIPVPAGVLPTHRWRPAIADPETARRAANSYAGVMAAGNLRARRLGSRARALHGSPCEIPATTCEPADLTSGGLA